MANGDVNEGRGPQDGPAKQPVTAVVADAETAAPPLNGGGSSTKARAVPHFTRAERAARGKSARAEVLRFAETYADQNQRDYEALKDAVDSGRLDARAGL